MQPAGASQPHMSSPSAILTIDLDAIATNFRLLAEQAQDAEVAPAVKANAYGLGLAPVAKALWTAGARSFCVAQPVEALSLRAVLPEARIFVLNGPLPEDLDTLVAARAIPMLNSPDQLALWQRAAAGGPPLAGALHLDTGMSRLGFSPEEVALLAREPQRLEGLEIVLVASHLSAAEELESPLNAVQVQRFTAMADALPPAAAAAPRSLANSSGVTNPAMPKWSVVRPGYAIYGGNPTPGESNPMRRVATLEAPILQVRRVPADTTIGYNATYVTKEPKRLATLAIGYADGYDRGLSNRGRVVIAGRSAAIIGRISMDLTVVDVSDIPEELCRVGSLATLIGEEPDLDEVAGMAETIGYEVLARLGNRLQRRYLGG